MISKFLEVLKAFGTGATVGVIFALVKLPVPAPAVAAGVAGVVGLWAGYALVFLLSSKMKGSK